MKNLISAKYFLIFYSSRASHHVRLLETVFCYCFQKNEIDLSKCRVQAHDGASTMSSEASAVSVIKKEQPFAEYTHCLNHILYLAIIMHVKINL